MPKYITHENDYISEYWHLSRVDVQQDEKVTRDVNNPIGVVGDTGKSEGIHLHFQVTNPSGKVVDPFGWLPIQTSTYYGQEDPWEHWNKLPENGEIDATSHYLWVAPLNDTKIKSNDEDTCITSSSGKAMAMIPVNAYASYLELDLIEMLIPPLINKSRVIYSFSLFGRGIDNQPISYLETPFEVFIKLFFDIETENDRSIPENYVIKLWDLESHNWIELPTSWNDSTNSFSASTDAFGIFVLSVPKYDLFLPIISK